MIYQPYFYLTPEYLSLDIPFSKVAYNFTIMNFFLIHISSISLKIVIKINIINNIVRLLHSKVIYIFQIYYIDRFIK